MSFENEYLSDEELNALIREIERNDLVMAPPDIMEKVLTQTKNKKRDFTMYCFRVAASAAAAIVMLFTLPGVLQNMSPKISDVVTDAYQKEMYETDIPTRQEVLAKQKYASKEEVLDETGFLNKIFQSISLVEKNIDFSIFKE